MIDKPESQRLDFLDALRGIGVIAVFTSHALGVAAPGLYSAIEASFALPSFGVFVFFLVSGFIIPASIERQNSLRVFWIRRICRLYPLYWLSILMIMLWYLFDLPYRINIQRFQPHQIAANLTMLQYILGYKNIIDMYWALEYEMIFYIVISCIFLLGLLKRIVTIICLLFALTISLNFVVIPLFNVKIIDQLPYYLSMMFVGVAFYRYYDTSISKKILFSILVCTILMMILTIFSRWEYRFALNLFVTRTVGLFVFTLLFSLRRKRFPSFIRYIGKISYSIYLLHIFVIYIIPQTQYMMLTLAIWFFATIGVASITYNLVERPMIQFGHHLTHYVYSKRIFVAH